MCRVQEAWERVCLERKKEEEQMSRISKSARDRVTRACEVETGERNAQDETYSTGTTNEDPSPHFWK